VTHQDAQGRARTHPARLLRKTWRPHFLFGRFRQPFQDDSK